MFHKSKDKAKQRAMAIKRYSEYAIREIDTPRSIFNLYDHIGEEFSDISSPKKKEAKTIDLYVEVISAVMQNYVSQGKVKKSYEVLAEAFQQVIKHQQNPSYIFDVESRLSYELGYNLVNAKQFACLDHPFESKIFVAKANLIYGGMIQAAIDSHIILEKDKKHIPVDDEGIKFLISKFKIKDNINKFMGFWLFSRGIASEWESHKNNLLRVDPNFIGEKMLRLSNRHQISLPQAKRCIYFKDLYKISDVQAKSLLTKSAWLWFVMGEQFLNKVWITPNGRLPLDVFLYIASFLTKLEIKDNKVLFDAINVRKHQFYDDLKSKQKPGLWNLRKKKNTANQTGNPKSELSKQAKR